MVKDINITQTKTSFGLINNLMGPTFPSKIINNASLLEYDGISFVFLYDGQESDNMRNLNMSSINIDNLK